jgi:hypothetical protein
VVACGSAAAVRPRQQWRLRFGGDKREEMEGMGSRRGLRGALAGRSDQLVDTRRRAACQVASATWRCRPPSHFRFLKPETLNETLSFSYEMPDRAT